MADKKKFPNPAFFRAKNNMDLKKQAENLKEVGTIALELIKETDWKAFGQKQKAHGSAEERREAPGHAVPQGRHGHGTPGVARRGEHPHRLLRLAEGLGDAAGHVLQGSDPRAEHHVLVSVDDLLYVLRGLSGQEHHGPAGQRAEDEPSDDPRHFPLCGGEPGIFGQV